MNRSKTYWEIYVKNRWHGRFATNTARIAALKELNRKRINPSHIKVNLCFGDIGKI